jgi:hypothetical protein
LWPGVMGAVEVRDAAKAKMFAEALAESIASGGSLSKKEEDGVTYWTLSLGIVVAQPTVAVSDKHLVVAINYATAVGAFKQIKAGGAGSLEQAEGFKNGLKALPTPGMGTLYIDTKKLFERLYEKVKPMAAMQLAGNPQVSKYIDPAKFPKAETFSKHLSPMTVVISNAPDGLIIESNGPVAIEPFFLPASVWLTFAEMRPRQTIPLPAAAPAPATPAPTPAAPAPR